MLNLGLFHPQGLGEYRIWCLTGPQHSGLLSFRDAGADFSSCGLHSPT